MTEAWLRLDYVHTNESNNVTFDGILWQIMQSFFIVNQVSMAFWFNLLGWMKLAIVVFRGKQRLWHVIVWRHAWAAAHTNSNCSCGAAANNWALLAASQYRFTSCCRFRVTVVVSVCQSPSRWWYPSAKTRVTVGIRVPKNPCQRWYQATASMLRQQRIISPKLSNYNPEIDTILTSRLTFSYWDYK